ncbi:MAG: hypothetical protein ABR923_12035 [Terracidiphilus sp.]
MPSGTEIAFMHLRCREESEVSNPLANIFRRKLGGKRKGADFRPEQALMSAQERKKTADGQ